MKKKILFDITMLRRWYNKVYPDAEMCFEDFSDEAYEYMANTFSFALFNLREKIYEHIAQIQETCRRWFRQLHR